MGMDVYGKAPDAPEGEYFRANVWDWRPLATYVCTVAPEITAHCALWHSNDGDGLDAENSRALAKVLREHIDSGELAATVESYRRAQQALPDEDCDICGGTGYRLEPPHTGPGERPCNACNATGKVRPWACWYPFEVETVERFAGFLEHCGGFEIH